MIDHPQPIGLLDAHQFGFSHAVRTDRPTHIFIAGQTATDAAGKPVGGDDLGDQTTAALHNLRVALEAADAGPADIVAVRVYVVGLQPSMFATIAPLIARFLGSASPPAATWVGVASLLIPSARIEIEAQAVVRNKPTAAGRSD
jgi:enamine deaminase RidA (YjgF/YER057c/UK114 family)